MKSETSRVLGLMLMAVMLMGVNACQKKPDDSATTEATNTTAAPLGYARTEGIAQVTLTLPEAIKQHPQLHTRLYNEGKTDLDEFITNGITDLAEMESSGLELMGYTRAIDWKIAGESPRLLSLYSEESEYTGGAHPNSQYQSLIWDKSALSEVSSAGLFADRAEIKDVDAFLCRQIEAERSKRVGEPITQAGSGYTCPHIADSKITLVPAASGNGFVAIEVLFSPYEIGPYFEGAYQIRLPYSVIRNVIAPAYADQFSGGQAAEKASDSASQP